MTLSKIIIVFVTVLLSACATHHPLQPTQPDDKASVMLAESANSVSRTLVELARIEKAVAPSGKVLLDPYPLDLKGTASVNWSGPIEPMLRRLANQTHFNLRVLGKSPQVPIIVTVSTYNAPLGSIFRDLDFQVGHRAEIMVFPETKTVELRYARL